MHVLWKNNERVCEKPECLRCTLKFRRPPQLWRYSGLLEKCEAAVDAFIAPSLFTDRMHHERGFKFPMTVIPHFVPEEGQGAPASSSSPHPRPYFLYAGRLEKIKGVETLLPVFRHYEHADLLIAGTGTLEAELRLQAEGMANVCFLGVLPQERLRDYYRHAIAVLVPSAGYEVLGLIILEAYMHRTPVIAHELGALTEVVERSQGGILYRDPRELLAAMDRLRSDTVLCRQMGDKGFQAYKEHWTEDIHMESYFRVLSETARRKLGFVPWERPARQSLQFPAATVSDAEAASANSRSQSLML
jgi:glycosyltransferase involved in cell wall biosynthesis